MRVAFVTSQALHDLTASDRLAAAALRARGVAVVPAVWTDPSVAWDRFDRVVIRSPWDYYHHRDRFLEWLDRLDPPMLSQFPGNPTALSTPHGRTDVGIGVEQEAHEDWYCTSVAEVGERRRSSGSDEPRLLAHGQRVQVSCGAIVADPAECSHR